MAGKGRSGTSKNLDPPTTKLRTPTSGSTRPIATPAITHGTSTADIATAIDAVAKTLVSNNSSNVRNTPRIPVERPHEGSIIPNSSRTKTSDETTAVKTRTPSKIDGGSADDPQPAKSEQAKDDESDEIESLFSAYRPVDGISAARLSSSKPLSRGLNSVGLGMASTATTTSNTASEASKRTATTFNIIGLPDAATEANKAITTIEATTSLFGGPGTLAVPSAPAANPNTTSISPNRIFTTSKSSQTRSVSLFGVPCTLGRSEQKPNTSGASSLPIDFGIAPTPNPATTPFSVPKMLETASKPNPAIASQFGMLSMPDRAPTSKPTTNSPFKIAVSATTPKLATADPFGVFKMAGTVPKTNLAAESQFGVLKMAGAAPTPNLETDIPFSLSKAPATAPVPNPAITSPFGLSNLSRTTPSPNPAITGPFGVFETAHRHNPPTTSPFGAFKITETAPTPHSATKGPLGKVKMPAGNIFSKSNFPTSDLGGSQTKAFFGNLSEQARQSKSDSFDVGSTGSSPFQFTATNSTGFHPGNGSSLETYNPAIFNEFKLPPMKQNFNPKMATTEGLTNTYEPMVPCGRIQPRDHTLSSPLKPFQTDSELPPANLTGNSTTHRGNQFGSSFIQTTNEITSVKREDLIACQRCAIQELQSSMAWLSEQNEIVSRNFAIATENLGVCGAQLQHFSKRCNDLDETCKGYREESLKLQEKSDKVNAMYAVEKEKASLALERLKKIKYTRLSICAIYVHILVCVSVTWFVLSIYDKIF